jgi:uncharacterized protein involved in outer membrane biogenesis
MRAIRLSDRTDMPFETTAVRSCRRASYSGGRDRPTRVPGVGEHHRAMKKTVAVIGLGVAAIACAVVALDLAGWPGLAPRLAQRYGVQLAPDARVHLLLRPRLAAAELRVTSHAGQKLAEAHGLALAWAWSDLWDWHRGAPLRLRRVEADTLDLDWQRDADGRTPWPLQPSADDTARPGPTPVPRIDHLVIRAGTARVDDRPLQLSGDARFASQAEGHWKADMRGRWRGQQLAVSAQADAGLALLSSPETDNAPVRLNLTLTQGAQRLSFDGTAASLLDARALDGALLVKGSSLAAVGKPFGVTLPNTPPFDLTGRLQHLAGVWRLDGAKARVGQSRLAGDFAYDARGERAMLSGLLRGGPLRMADLGPAVGTDTPPSRAGRLLPDRKFDLPALNAMDARVAVALSQLDLGTPKLEPLAPVNVSVVLESGVLTLADLSAGVAGGVIAGSAQLDTRSNPPLFQTSLDARNLAVERWYKFDAKSLTQHPLTGNLQAELDLKSQGSSTAALLGGASGPVRVRIRDGSISHLLTEAMGLDLAQGLGMLIKGDSNLPLHCATLDGRFTSGVLRPRSAIVDNRDSRIDLDGAISLKDETLDLRMVAKPKDFSPLTLRAPVRVQGTLADPRVALEGKRLGGRAIAALALGALATPAAALLAFVDPGEELPPVDCSLSPTGKPREAAVKPAR